MIALALLSELVVSDKDTRPEDVKKVKGIVMEGEFDIKKLEEAIPAIEAYLNAFPDEIRSDEGLSIKDTYKFKNGYVWCESTSDADALITLAIAAGLLEIVEPRDQWNVTDKSKGLVFPHIRQIPVDDDQK